MQHLQRSRVGLPEILQSYGQPAADIARKNQPGRSFPRAGEQPAALRIRALLNLETVGVRLHQLVGVPNRPVIDQGLALRIELSLVGHALAGKLRGVDLSTRTRAGSERRGRGGAGGGQHARSRQRLQRLGPQPLAFG